jgi:hypothetical protein
MSLSKEQSILIIKNVLAGDNSKNNPTAGSNSILNSVNPGWTTGIKDYARRQNSINAVTELLKGFLDTTSMEILKAEGKKAATMAESLDNASGFGKNISSKYLPSYNVRTPIVEITINGYPIYPNKRILGTTQVVESRLNFQSFNLKLPMGGPEKSVVGELVLFTKNPEEILSYTESWATEEDAKKTMSGLPMLTLRFGWAFSDSTSVDNKDSKQINDVSAMSPQMNFIITNIGMTDPGTAGTTFTLTLQELGTVLLQNSSENLIINSDYPQQQLRVLLEGIMRVRLFTLDDILYLGNKNTINESLGQTTGILDKQVLDTIIPTYQEKNKRTGEIRKTPLITDSQDYTFFTNDKSADIGINNRNFEAVAEELAAQCRCKWFPHKNGDKDDEVRTRNASSKLSKIAADLEMLKSLPPDAAISLEQFNDIQKTLGEDVLITTPAESKDFLLAKSVLASLEEAKKSNLARLAARCRLIWVSNVPADWNTTGSLFYSNNKNNNDPNYKPEAYTEGAYFLLPDILDDFDIFTQDLPICYGSGASNMPYFYGSGQNVFQTSLGTKQPELFGEVLQLSTNHSNLIAQLATSVKEELAYAIEGKRLYGIQAADKYGTIDSKKATARVRDSSKRTQQEIDDMNAKGQAIISKTKKDIYDGGIKAKLRSGESRLGYGSLALGSANLLLGDHPSLRGSNKSSALTDIGGPAQTASLRIRTRISNFLRFPTAAKITVLGDPNLLRLGPGCFELFSYYPVENQDGSITQELNALTSGVYFVQSIEHNITMGDFTTTLNGTKAVDPINVPSSITLQVFNKLSAEQEIEKTNKLIQQRNEEDAGVINTSKSDIKSSQISKTLASQFSSVNLNSNEFKTGFLADTLRSTLSDYKTLK